MDAKLCLQQLRYSGIFEAVRIRQLGFPFRWSYKKFYERYHALDDGSDVRGGAPKAAKGATGRLESRDPTAIKEMVSAMVARLQSAAGAGVLANIRLGRTMVLYRADANQVHALALHYVSWTFSMLPVSVFYRLLNN